MARQTEIAMRVSSCKLRVPVADATTKWRPQRCTLQNGKMVEKNEKRKLFT